ncbi:MAG TPA: UDP-N-acetylglucosamine 2-epimerase [Tepidisphaeraceae bacterium]|jgi:UDP-hydrolysing UDP-N-acetyl-D-glucosamine 2-epimerase|nr:UDP-N-acetylglucosamine 2-epimerase [Tepidisphaeraceae bacterium]
MGSTSQKRRICFVTGTRAEFGLMESTLRAIQSHPKLQLQLIATGMHLDRAHGQPLSAIREAGFKPNITIPWPSSKSPSSTAQSTGRAIASLSSAFQKLKPHIILIVGDRVEAFAAASTAHISQIPIAHIHGGDRALGQVDDSLRHAITKLSHIHLPATKESANRIAKLGEDRFRIQLVGSPANDNIHKSPAPWSDIAKRIPQLRQRRYALLLLHPVSPDAATEAQLALGILSQVVKTGFDHTVIIYPNNDPGSSGILSAWELIEKFRGRVGAMRDRITLFRDLPRSLYLAFLKHAASLVGNSSSGIIEAASFSTPVLDIGPRQLGRQRSQNVRHCDYDAAQILRSLKLIWNNGQPRRSPAANVYGRGDTSRRIASLLASIPLDNRLRRKLISY